MIGEYVLTGVYKFADSVFNAAKLLGGIKELGE